MDEKPEKWIFISSPGDVAAERVIADRVFRRLAKEFEDELYIRLVLWELEPLYAHGDFQRQIKAPSTCDLVIAILWTRLGTPLPAEYAPEPGQEPPTGTEWEIADARSGHEANGRPDLLIYIKRAPAPASLTDDDLDHRRGQYKRLEAFCRQTFYDEAGASVVAHHSFREAAEFERKLLEHARKWVESQILDVQARPRWIAGSPFRGLQPFDADYRDVFFGRSQAISELIHRIAEAESTSMLATPLPHLLLVVGMSGSGKTSVIRAGLLPQLQDLPIEGITLFRAVTLRPSALAESSPTTGPFGAVAEKILAEFSDDGLLGATLAILASELEARPDGAAVRIEGLLRAARSGQAPTPRSANPRLVIYVDQLEEIFTLPALATRAEAFLNLLVSLASNRYLWVIATLRSDFTHRLEAHAPFMGLLQQSSAYTLLPPRGPELAEIIREPAIAAGLRFEELGGVPLDHELLHDASLHPESLPLLQFALEQLYEHRDARTLLWSVYRPADRPGGLNGSLVATAEALLESGQAQGAFRRVMRELTSVGDDGSATRRYASLEGFAQGSAERALLDRLIDARLCVADQAGGIPVVFFAHEALLESWPRVRSWLTQESAMLRLRDELQRDAKTWAAHERKEDWLGATPEKLLSIAVLEREGLIGAGIERDYADRSRKRARRNQTIRSAVTVALVVLALISALAGWMAMRQRDRALTEAATSARTSQFLVELFRLADPSESRGSSITVREVLDRGAKSVTRSLDHDPTVRAPLLTAMGEAYSGLGLYASASQLLAQARLDNDAGHVAAANRIRTLIASGTNAFDAAEYEQARPLLEAALSAARQSLKPGDPLRSEALTALARLYAQTDRAAEAVTLCNEALAADRQRGGHGAGQLATSLDTLGTAYFFLGQFPAAESALRESLALRQKVYGEHDARTLQSMNNLGVTLYQAGKFGEAATLQRRALPLYEEIYGSEHPEVATALNNAARSALMAGDVEVAEPLFRRSLAITEKTVAPDHDDLVAPLNSLGMIDTFRQRYGEARAELARAEQIARLPDHGELLDQVLVNLADLDALQGHADDAARRLKEARDLLARNHPLDRDPGDSWRYAVIDSVECQLLTAGDDRTAAQKRAGHAREVLLARFGAQGFYIKRLEQRETAIGADRSDSRRNSASRPHS